jgi:hypothetical protein
VFILDTSWPDTVTSNAVCFTIDVEWAASAVIEDVRSLFDQHGVAATFFVTHADVDVPGHERGLHPNFRRNGDTYLAMSNSAAALDEAVHEHVLGTTLSFAPEAKGVRSHSLYYDSTLLPIYQRLGIEYDCTYQMPFVEGLRPFWKHNSIVEIPTYYADYLDLMSEITAFDASRIRFDRPGIKILDFHPNLIYLNAPSVAFFNATKSFYQDPERLRAARHQGHGIRTFLLDLLALIATREIYTTTTGKLNALWRGTVLPQSVGV